MGVKDYSIMINRPIRISQDAFYHSLKSEGLIESFSNGSSMRNTKRFIDNDRNLDVSMVVINKRIFEKFIKDKEGGEK